MNNNFFAGWIAFGFLLLITGLTLFVVTYVVDKSLCWLSASPIATGVMLMAYPIYAIHKDRK